MRSHGASLVRASAALALATAAGAADRPGAEPFDEALARGAREPLEAIVRAYQATEPPAPLDAAQVGVVAAWEIARDAGTHGVARYEALGQRIWRTDRDGALHVTLGTGPTSVRAWRQEHRRYWHGR